ncbi:MAG: hypothetical protein JXL81_13055 [Deltaproteobacteria bacterium]|nr:hypothetical protein [Deltaproteobacteria bacterium]
MIIYIKALIKDIFEFGREYPWPRPRSCPRCGHSTVWGHGYIAALFDGYDKALQLKRYRCPCCGCVICLRPSSHLSRFQVSTEKIRTTLSIRIKTGRWPPDCSVSRAGHWLRSLKRKSFTFFGYSAGKDLIRVFDYLLLIGVNPASRSMT